MPMISAPSTAQIAATDETGVTSGFAMPPSWISLLAP